jgi:hypothetical protein
MALSRVPSRGSGEDATNTPVIIQYSSRADYAPAISLGRFRGLETGARLHGLRCLSQRVRPCGSALRIDRIPVLTVGCWKERQGLIWCKSLMSGSLVEPRVSVLGQRRQRLTGIDSGRVTVSATQLVWDEFMKGPLFIGAKNEPTNSATLPATLLPRGELGHTMSSHGSARKGLTPPANIAVAPSRSRSVRNGVDSLGSDG